MTFYTLTALGLNLSITKCELISSSVVAPPFQLLKSLLLVLPADASLLGAPCSMPSRS
jgi:hypothetical protein